MYCESSRSKAKTMNEDMLVEWRAGAPPVSNDSSSAANSFLISASVRPIRGSHVRNGGDEMNVGMYKGRR
jgi:hypothetical protein